MWVTDYFCQIISHLEGTKEALEFILQCLVNLHWEFSV